MRFGKSLMFSDWDDPGAEREWRPEQGQASLWLQWKGTDVCADFRCACGYDQHLDDTLFLYFLKCPACSAIYRVNAHVQLIPLTKDEAEQVTEDRLPIVNLELNE